MICMSTIMMGASLDIHPEHYFWKVCETFFTLFFLSEFMASIYKNGWLYHETIWNVFDLVCILITFGEFALAFVALFLQWQPHEMGLLLKVLRLARLGRLARLSRYKFC